MATANRFASLDAASPHLEARKGPDGMNTTEYKTSPAYHESHEYVGTGEWQYVAFKKAKKGKKKNRKNSGKAKTDATDIHPLNKSFDETKADILPEATTQFSVGSSADNTGTTEAGESQTTDCAAECSENDTKVGTDDEKNDNSGNNGKDLGIEEEYAATHESTIHDTAKQDVPVETDTEGGPETEPNGKIAVTEEHNQESDNTCKGETRNEGKVRKRNKHAGRKNRKRQGQEATSTQGSDVHKTDLLVVSISGCIIALLLLVVLMNFLSVSY